MKIIGISKIVSNQQPEEIMTLWEGFFQNNISGLIPNKMSTDVLCLYTDYQGDYRHPYKMIIGHEVGQDTLTPEGLESIEFTFDNHTPYSVQGELPKVVMEKWQEIWRNGRPRTYKTDFQRHHSDGSVDIFVEYK
jgi:predicted transcriptional regulator YdeE